MTRFPYQYTINLVFLFNKMMNWFNFFKKKSGISSDAKDMKKFLIVGLGNPGAEYVRTRHNIGFKVVDFLANEKNADFQTVKLGNLAEIKLKGRTLLLLKPNTYMNLSGKAVKYWLDKEKIPVENLLIITDDLNLPFGTLRLKAKGSDGGHNGLKSIQNTLQSTNYPRFRFGISDEFKKGRQVDYVLGEWDEEEKNAIPERLQTAAEAIKSFALAGLNITMNQYNGK